MKNRSVLFLMTLITFFCISCNSRSDKEQVKGEFEKLNIILTDSFKILEFKCSGLTDYTLDFELLTNNSTSASQEMLP